MQMENKMKDKIAGNIQHEDQSSGSLSSFAERPSDYYRRLKRRLQFSLLISYMVPLIILVVYFQFQFNFTLKKSGKEQLITLAESQRNTIDLFLQERIINIFNLFHNTQFSLQPSTDDMMRYLQHLRNMNDSFVDVGFFDSIGVQIGYAGPFPYLQGQDYSKEIWFQSLANQNRNYYISDIYQGIRQKPHFTIAVKQIFDSSTYIMRATLDPDKFYMFLRTIDKDKGEDSSIINEQGLYQIVDPYQGNFLGRSNYRPSLDFSSGAEEIIIGDSTTLTAFAWLKEVPWALVVRKPLRTAYAELYHFRRIMIAVTIVIVMLIVTAIMVTTEKLIKNAQRIQESRQELRSQLFHASKLVAVGELASGVAHEINNPLAIIAAESGVIRDMLDLEIPMEGSTEDILGELDQIDTAVYRARDITQKLLNFARRSEPKLQMTNMNRLLDEIVFGVKMKEFEVSNIEIEKEYDEDLTEILLDRDHMRQVILNLINNAGDAIEGGGKITLTTSQKKGNVRVTITDDGKGIKAEDMEMIFIPFYTSKEVGKGTGLGLSISQSIVQMLGGRIDVQSMLGVGSSFSIVLPVNQSQESINKS